MKNKDIQKALKINGLDIMNGHALHLIHTRVRVIVIIDDIEMVKKKVSSKQRKLEISS
jgi:hypothetical protein